MNTSVARIVLAAALLRKSAYGSIANDPRFWPVAIAIVAMGAISHALLGVSWATAGGWAVITSVVPALVSNLDLWLGISVVGWAGGRLLGSTLPLGGVARAVGVAALPSLLYAFGAFLPPVLPVMAAWWLAATFVSLLGALKLDVVRTVIVTIAGIVAGYLLALVTTPALASMLG